jgi:hypothetical protein
MRRGMGVEFRRSPALNESPAPSICLVALRCTLSNLPMLYMVMWSQYTELYSSFDLTKDSNNGRISFGFLFLSNTRFIIVRVWFAIFTIELMWEVKVKSFLTITPTSLTSSTLAKLDHEYYNRITWVNFEWMVVLPPYNRCYCHRDIEWRYESLCGHSRYVTRCVFHMCLRRDFTWH